ncbi:hypothetical protein N7492_010081 [Penicillium capsulatum]|uniref:DUF6536 domain-containing protein n=1 Tax=Penicillium capsulatum TaxID=69766 RepID=A0A9W9HNX5_9EURO|nr:hypothetical protein N7492_010081 [Penicillium capsulatum]KAJ6112589.1 hypothetical protein N7512_007913 [Penicillium capsulatum]
MSTAEIPLMSRDDAETMHESSAKATPTMKSKALEAWRFTVASGALAGSLIFLINVITLAVMYGKYESVDYSITFHVGNCKTAKSTTIGAHIVINVLSTVLLAYSNFSMQCLGSPTRKEVDAAHSKNYWLSIGTPTIRNLRFVSKSRSALWLILRVSSFPLHMIWNSTVFETQASYDYLAIVATENFARGGNWTLRSPSESADAILYSLQAEAMRSKLRRLEVRECIEKYHTDFLSDRQHVLLIVDNSTSAANESTSSVGSIFVSKHSTQDYYPLEALYGWICDIRSYSIGQQCLSDHFNYDNWTPGTSLSSLPPSWETKYPVRYCLSREADEKCKIASFVCALGITKENPPLCTTGDAIQSFLTKPDVHTRNRCLASKEDYDRWQSGSREEWYPRPPGTGDVWTGGRYRWRKAISIWQGLLFTFIAAGIIASAGGPLATAWATDDLMSVLRNFAITNLPQVAVSYVYLVLNNMMTAMLAMAEWCTYAANSTPRKGLRVSSPTPGTSQRSKYFLSVPYKWAIPSIVTITVLHWLVSQMIFFNQIGIYQITPEGGYNVSTENDTYVSRFAALLSVCIASAVFVTLIAIAWTRRYPKNIPLSGCCSASIAAACQPTRFHGNKTLMSDFDPHLPFEKLGWGVVEDPADCMDGIGHATFSSEGITSLMTEKVYA